MIYFLFFFVSGFIVLNTAGFLDPVFNFLGVGAGLRLASTQILALVLGFALFLGNGIRAGSGRALLRLSVPWVLWLAYLAYTTPFFDPFSAKKLYLIAALGFLTVLAHGMVYQGNPEKYVKWFYAGLLVQAGILGAVFIFDPSITYVGSDLSLYGQKRTVRPTVGGINPIWLSRTFGLAFVALLFVRRIPFWLRATLAVLCLLGMVLTGSRGPILAVLIVAAGYFLLRGGNLAGRIGLGFLGAALVGLLMVASGEAGKLQAKLDSYFSRGSQTSIYESSGRKVMFSIALEDFTRHPLVGKGLGRFGKPETVSGVTSIEESRYFAHNFLLEVLSETGLIGLILVLAVIRPGRWMFDRNNSWTYFFWLNLLFAMTSGDLINNVAVYLFAALARLATLRQAATRTTTSATRPYRLGYS